MKTNRPFLAVLALTMSFAGVAAAQQPAEPPPPPPPPPPMEAAPPAPMATMPAAGPTLGSAGQVAISDDMQLVVVHTSQSFMGQSISQNAIGLQPALDFFVAPNFSIGGQLQIAFSSLDLGAGNTSDSTVLGFAPRVGYNIALAPSTSIWPRLSIGYLHQSTSPSGGGASQSGYTVDLEVFVPVVFHPAPHFFIGAGPIVTTDLVSKVEVMGTSMDSAKTTNIGLLSTLGGYFGGM